MISVMGATGNTGKKITEALLRGGQKVRSLGRSEGNSRTSRVPVPKSWLAMRLTSPR